MSCYYHPKVPTLTVCPDCGHEICSACSVDSICPGCRLGRAMRAASGQALSTEHAPPRNDTYGTGFQRNTAPPEARPAAQAVVVSEAGDEDRALAAVSYPLWPLALGLIAFRGRLSPFVRYHAMQALLVNALGVGAYFVYSAAANLPVIGWQSALVLPILLPTWFIINLYLGIRAYGGHVTRVPLAADYAAKYSKG